MKTVRWLLVVPSAALGWVGTAVTAVGMDGLLNRLCPPELFISGMCMARWYPAAETVAHATAAAVGAGLFVALPTLLAPAHRRRVAVWAFAVGSLSATGLVAWLGSAIAVPFVAALVAGLLMTWRFNPHPRRGWNLPSGPPGP